jgi:putative transposase|tara:strand:- start:132 stop:296 length:165 start_codon:yes stop_codon:yes gene_type:complete
LIEICEAEGIEIMKGVVSSDHVHLHIEYASKLNVSTILKKLKEHHESFNKNFQN